MTELGDLVASNALRRTLLQAQADVIRECRGQATTIEARQALQDAINAIDASANWEFLLATRLINLHASYSTGTVSVSSGDTLVTLTGGTWPTTVSPFGEYREIKFGERGMPYKISEVTSSTEALLTTSLSGTTSTNIVNGTYTLYQARYPLPIDCEPGRDLSLKGGDSIGNIPKRERLIWDRKSNQIIGGSFDMYYTDDEYDEDNGVGTIRVEPPPSSAIEVRMTYYRKMLIPDGDEVNMFMMPQAFERAPVLAAAANICRRKNIQGWQQMRAEAGDLLNKMYNRHASSPAYEGRINPDLSDLFGDDESVFAADSQMFIRE